MKTIARGLKTLIPLTYKPEAKQPFFRRPAFDADVRIEAQHPRCDPELIESGPRDDGQQIGGLWAEPVCRKCILQGLHTELELGLCFWRRVFQSEEIESVCIVNTGTTLARWVNLAGLQCCRRARPGQTT